jgi:Uma2 family endonuclease
MSGVKKLQPISVEDYLAGELVSQVKHEYDGGYVYAMSGARVTHNRIATRITSALDSRLVCKGCEPFNSDMKVRIPAPPRVRFYYPDAMVVCDSNAGDESYQDRPVVIFEVLSQGTRRLDQGEKKDGYLQLPSLGVYALVEQEMAKVVVYRRHGKEFLDEVYEGLEATIPLPEIGIVLPLSELYRGIEFSPEIVPE